MNRPAGGPRGPCGRPGARGHHVGDPWCRILCTGSSENGGIARAASVLLSFQKHLSFWPSVLSKEGKRGRRCLFIIGVGVGKFLWCKEFCPNFPKLARKVFCETFTYKFSSTRSWTPLFGNLQKKVCMCFYVNLGCHFLKSNNVGRHFYPDFQAFCQDFQQIRTFGGALVTPASPPPTQLLFIAVSG